MENKELETWLAETKAKNLNRDELYEFISLDSNCSVGLYLSLKEKFNLNNQNQVTDYLFNQWQKEKEFSPKRGDRVLVWNEDKNFDFERIFLTEIKGTQEPIYVVAKQAETSFIDGGMFYIETYEHMKPLPTEQPKETIEEASEIYAEQNAKDPNISYHNLFSPLKYAFIEGARWQSEQPKEEIRICKYCGAKLDTNEKEEECYAKPKETDFKSQVIELLKVLIDESLEKLGAALNAKSYQDVLAWKISNQERGQLLEKIEQLN